MRTCGLMASFIESLGWSIAVLQVGNYSKDKITMHEVHARNVLEPEHCFNDPVLPYKPIYLGNQLLIVQWHALSCS